MNEMGRHVAYVKGQSCVCRVLVGKPEGRRTDRRHGHRWKGNIKMDLNGMGWEKNILLNNLNYPLDVILWLTCSATRSISTFGLKYVSTSTITCNGWSWE